MGKKRIRNPFPGVLLRFALFLGFTIALKIIDLRPIGPEGSVVGFAAINGFFFRLLGTSNFWYQLTKLLGYISFLAAGGFALIGLLQWIRRKSLVKVDYRLLLLAGFYVLIIVFYGLFEKLIVNYRPVILDESAGLEASYPSSHTMMLLCILATARLLLPRFCKNKAITSVGRTICIIMMILMPVGRLLSGVHWFTDIVGACLLSAALVSLYKASTYALGRKINRKKRAARQR